MPLLPPEALSVCCDPKSFSFLTTAELADPASPLGQERALTALRLAVDLPGTRFNVMVSGAPGLGRHAMVRKELEAAAARRPVPDDWCYVNNFKEPHRPRAVRLPPGRGRDLRESVRQATDELRTALPAIFESDEYRNRREEIDIEFNERESSTMQGLADEARTLGIALIRTPAGFGLAPVKDEEVISPEEFEKLPQEDQDRLRSDLAVLHDKLHKILRQIPQLGRERHRRIQALTREFSILAVDHILGELRQDFGDLPAVVAFLEAAQADIVDNSERLRPAPDGPGGPAPVLDPAAFSRYQVNLLVDHGNGGQAAGPVVFVDHPSHGNLVGRVEHQERMGTLITDFSLIKPGALHRANGGFMVLDARQVLMQPMAWDSLKRALHAGAVRPESLAQVMSLISTISLEPEAIPLDVKVVLIGEPPLFELLHAYDPDFPKLFKVLAEFDDRMPRDAASIQAFAATVGALARAHGLRPLSADGAGRLVDHASRLAEDQLHFSTRLESFEDLLREADRYAATEECKTLDGACIKRAIRAGEERAGRLRDRVRQAILRNTLRVETSGERIGQVNALSVIDLGHTAFAHPTRITGTVRLGEGDVVDIQREVDLGGSLHSKGVMILSAFLATRYASTLPLTLHATLTFEQTYGEVDGDSASMGELCVLLSALAEAPIRQSIAITGSVDQFGHAQAIGGVNEKIEGFFDICQARGLAAGQGVIIPESNTAHLMLRADVVSACAEGRFSVHTYANADEAMALLTGEDPGLPDDNGVVAEGSINYRVGMRLLEYAAIHQSFASSPTPRRRRKARPKGKPGA